MVDMDRMGNEETNGLNNGVVREGREKRST